MTDQPTLKVLSLGAGVQSTVLALMNAEGILPKLDAAIFADTGWEPQAVYDHLDRLEVELNRAGIPLHRVSAGNLHDDVLNPNKMRSIPAYTASKAYEVTVVDTWSPCPDETCPWRQLRVVDDSAAEQDALFAAIAIDLGDLFAAPELVGLVPAGTSLAQVEAVVDQDADDLGFPAARVAKAMRCAGLDEVPQPHGMCKSTGRVPATSHTEIRRDFGMLGRKCTQQYKLRPILEQVRLLLGAQIGEEKVCRYCDGTGERVAPWRAKRGEEVVAPCSVCDGLGIISRVGQPPAGVWAEQWIGFSTDEIGRISSRGDTQYSRSRYPLLELDMSRTQCEQWLQARGWTSVAKSACIGCPFHGNLHWREMRDNDPQSWQAAVAFDHEYRTGLGLRHERFLHPSCVPLDRAPIDQVQRRELIQVNVVDAIQAQRAEYGDPDGCSPWACRSGVAVPA